MIRHSSRSRERMAIRVSAEDHMYLEHLRDILLAEPCRGVPTEPHQLLPHMYIGNQSNAESLRLLRRLGITHVLNCAGFRGPRTIPEMSPYEGLGIDYLEFKAEDHDLYDIVKHFHEAFSFLDRAHRSHGVVLVHCAMGINRSAATCIGYMMQHKNWTLFKTAQLIKDKRKVVLSNKGFQLQLIRFARGIHMLDKLELPTSRTRESRSREVHHHPSRRQQVTCDLPAPHYQTHSLPPTNYQTHSLPPTNYQTHSLPPTNYSSSLPPISYPDNGLPPRRRRQKTYVSTYSQPTVTSHYQPSNDYRRSSLDYRGNYRKDGSMDLLSSCINDTLRISSNSNDTLHIGPRSNSVGRYRSGSVTRAY